MTSPFQGGARSHDFILTETCHFTVCFTICTLNSQMALGIAQKAFILAFQNCVSYQCRKDLQDKGRVIICGVPATGGAAKEAMKQNNRTARAWATLPSLLSLETQGLRQRTGAVMQRWIIQLLALWVSVLLLTSNCKRLITHLIWISLSKAQGKINQGFFRTFSHSRSSKRQYSKESNRPVGLQIGQCELSTHFQIEDACGQEVQAFPNTIL